MSRWEPSKTGDLVAGSAAAATLAQRPRARALDRDQIIEAAARFADAEGLPALVSLTSPRLAERLHIRAACLQDHFPDLKTLREALALRGFGELAEFIREAVGSRVGKAAFHALAHGARTYAQARPSVFLAAVQCRGNVGGAATGRAALIDQVAGILEGYEIKAEAGREVARGILAAIFGFTVVELNGGEDSSYEMDQSYQRLVELLEAGARGLQ